MNKAEKQLQTPEQRIARYFSEDFKRKKVQEVDNNLTSVIEVSRTYQVSRTAVYAWLYKYSLLYKKGLKQVVEAKSDTHRIKQLQQQIKHLEQPVGQKQLKIEFLDKMIELTEQQYKIDIKKKLLPYPIRVLEASKRTKDQHESALSGNRNKQTSLPSVAW